MPGCTRRQFLIGAACTAVLAGCSRGVSTAVRGMRYRVVDGDTLSSLARRSGLAISTIVEANDLRSRHLRPGQHLYLPGVRELAADAPLIPEHRAVPPSAQPGTDYRLVSRAEWGASSLRANHDPMHGIRRITLHHTSEIPGMMHRSDQELVAAVQRYHQDQQGWADIGYHYIVGRDGRIYEGRPITAQGAHVGGARNRHNLGIAAVGDFHRQMPTAAQLTAIAGFLGDQMRAHRVTGRQLFGHRELGITVCPGDRLYAWLEEYRRKV